MQAELLESIRRSGGDFPTFMAYWDGAIAKVILSQTMTTDNGSSMAQANVHMEVREDVVKGDADLACESFNDGPGRWLHEWNFPNAAQPKVWRLTEEPEDLKESAERDKMIHDMGFQPSEEYIRDKYGDGWEPKTQAPPQAPAADPVAAFADPPEGDAADELTDQADAAAAPAFDDMIDRIRELVDGATDLQDVADGLVDLYPEMDTADLAEAMRRAFVVADLRGRSEILDG